MVFGAQVVGSTCITQLLLRLPHPKCRQQWHKNPERQTQCHQVYPRHWYGERGNHKANKAKQQQNSDHLCLLGMVGSSCGAYPEVKISKRVDDWTCEAGIDIDYSGHAPRIILCRKPAKLYGIITLCDDHKDLLKKKSKPKE